MVGHGGSSAGTYLADPTSPIPSHCASNVVTSTVGVKYALMEVFTHAQSLNMTNESMLSREGMGDVGSARYELALLPPFPTIRVTSKKIYV